MKYKTKIISFEDYHNKLRLYNQFFGFFENDYEDTSVDEYSMFDTLAKDYLDSDQLEQLREAIFYINDGLRSDLENFINKNK